MTESVTHWLRALPAKFQFIGLSTETDMHIVKFENPSLVHSLCGQGRGDALSFVLIGFTQPFEKLEFGGL